MFCREIRLVSIVLACLAFFPSAPNAQSNDLPTSYAPPWALAVPKRVIRLQYDPDESSLLKTLKEIAEEC